MKMEKPYPERPEAGPGANPHTLPEQYAVYDTSESENIRASMRLQTMARLIVDRQLDRAISRVNYRAPDADKNMESVVRLSIDVALEGAASAIAVRRCLSYAERTPQDEDLLIQAYTAAARTGNIRAHDMLHNMLIEERVMTHPELHRLWNAGPTLQQPRLLHAALAESQAGGSPQELVAKYAASPQIEANVMMQYARLKALRNISAGEITTPANLRSALAASRLIEHPEIALLQTQIDVATFAKDLPLLEEIAVEYAQKVQQEPLPSADNLTSLTYAYESLLQPGYTAAQATIEILTAAHEACLDRLPDASSTFEEMSAARRKAEWVFNGRMHQLHNRHASSDEVIDELTRYGNTLRELLAFDMSDNLEMDEDEAYFSILDTYLNEAAALSATVGRFEDAKIYIESMYYKESKEMSTLLALEHMTTPEQLRSFIPGTEKTDRDRRLHVLLDIAAVGMDGDVDMLDTYIRYCAQEIRQLPPLSATDMPFERLLTFLLRQTEKRFPENTEAIVATTTSRLLQGNGLAWIAAWNILQNHPPTLQRRVEILETVQKTDSGSFRLLDAVHQLLTIPLPQRAQ